MQSVPIPEMETADMRERRLICMEDIHRVNYLKISISVYVLLCRVSRTEIHFVTGSINIRLDNH